MQAARKGAMRDISKSRYLSGMQCPKLLWIGYRKPRLIPPTDPATQAMFDQGHEVGALAQRLFPGGLEVDWNPNPRATVRQTADLLLPFRGFRAYDPAQHGSASLKAVLPAFTSRSYADMAIADGGMAAGEYARVMFGGADRDLDAVLRHLEEYCGQDTYGMILILDELRRLARGDGG